jgi:hypothetical protein
MNMLQKIKLFLSKKRIYDWLDLLPYKYRHWYWDKIKPMFKPCHSRLRKAIPRQWRDLTSLVVDINFEIIKSFYEDEYKLNTIDWSSTKNHAKFEKWLKKAYRYITVERKILETRLNNSYPPTRSLEEMFVPTTDSKGNKVYQMIDDGIPYEVKYKDVIKFEGLIEKKDTEVITKMIQYRGYFWT